MHAQIAFTNRAQDRVGNCMCKSIGIRVTITTTIRGDMHAAEYKRSAFHQPVRIVADADAKQQER